MASKRVIIVGAGISGLICALHCQKAGFETLLLEQNTELGGRVGTDYIDGFNLDRGFQVLLTAYPMAKKYLDYKALDLCYYPSGAYLCHANNKNLLENPLEDPQALFSTLNTVGTSQIWPFLKLITPLILNAPQRCLTKPESSSLAFLKRLGFSKPFIDAFFKPFFGGVLLDPNLESSSRLFTYYLSFFMKGKVAIPKAGMAEIPKQLASHLKGEQIKLNCKVLNVEAKEVELEGGKTLQADAVVLATNPTEAASILKNPKAKPPHTKNADGFRNDVKSVYTFYYALNEDSISSPILDSPYLLLNSSSKGPLTHLHIQSNIATSYAPKSQKLISITSLKQTHQDPQTLEPAIRHQAQELLHIKPSALRLLKASFIKEALPTQRHIKDVPLAKDGIFLAGDWTQTGSLQGAMLSGERIGFQLAQCL